MTRGSFCTWSMSPSASTRPSCSTVTRLAIERTKSMSCSTTTTECLPASDSSSSAVRSVSCGVMPATGSSTSSSSGPASAACRSPATASGRATARRPAGRALLGQADDLEHLVDAVALRRRQARAAASARTTSSPASASSRFSNTVSCSNTVGFWNLRPMPAWAISGSDSVSRSMLAAEPGRSRRPGASSR